eukprot:GHVT01061222.1.p1 GENE.GHVT01061222.1~~GHVT01061222.1.p1  ORF type:complete len:192 (-),score=90.69 GHVT01061222.1:52-627(-)
MGPAGGAAAGSVDSSGPAAGACDGTVGRSDGPQQQQQQQQQQLELAQLQQQLQQLQQQRQMMGDGLGEVPSSSMSSAGVALAAASASGDAASYLVHLPSVDGDGALHSFVLPHAPSYPPGAAQSATHDLGRGPAGPPHQTAAGADPQPFPRPVLQFPNLNSGQTYSYAAQSEFMQQQQQQQQQQTQYDQPQ